MPAKRQARAIRNTAKAISQTKGKAAGKRWLGKFQGATYTSPGRISKSEKGLIRRGTAAVKKTSSKSAAKSTRKTLKNYARGGKKKK